MYLLIHDLGGLAVLAKTTSRPNQVGSNFKELLIPSSATGHMYTTTSKFVSESCCTIFLTIEHSKQPRISHPYICHLSYAGGSQNFNETFLDMEPVVRDVEDGEDQADTNQGRQTDTDRREGETSFAMPSPTVLSSTACPKSRGGCVQWSFLQNKLPLYRY
jgi:hypothetical protein